MFFNNERDEEKQEFAEALLKLFAILAISEIGYSSAKFKSFLIALNMKIGADTFSAAEIVQEIKAHIKNDFDKEDIKDALINKDASNAIVYLNEYLFAKEKGITIDLDINKVEIEHIMPASGRNISSIREDAGMNEEEFKQYANQLGNKILLEQSINGAISNDWFKTKKQTSVKEKHGYKDSVFPIAESLTAYPKDKWEKEDIEAATLKAAERITAYIFS